MEMTEKKKIGVACRSCDPSRERRSPKKPEGPGLSRPCWLFAVFSIALALFSRPFAAGASGWSTAEENGIYWLVTPEGNPAFSKGVNIVKGWEETSKSRERLAYYWGNFYPSVGDWMRDTRERLETWGFNTLGGWSDPSPELGLALTVDLELGRNAKFHWFDPFEPEMEQKVMTWAENLTAPYRNNPRLIGYYSDNEVGWWNSPLFQWFLKCDWENHTKRVLWQLLVDHYGGKWEDLEKDWVPADGYGSFEDLKRKDASMKLRPGGAGIRVVNRFMFQVTQRYYALMAKAIRKAHPGALVLGDRFPLYYHQDAVLSMGDNVDIISTNYNVDVPDGWVAPYYFNGLRQLADKPVMVTEFFFAAEENRSGNRNETARNIHPKPGHLMTVTTQEERARGTAAAIRNFAGFPNVVGAHWFQFADEPFGGREDGEDYNMGLLDTGNRPYEQLTEVFRRLNPQLESIHAQSSAHRPLLAAASLPQGAVEGGRYEIVRAERPPQVRDQSLMDWDKENTRILGFVTRKPYVPFGDVHLTWTPEGLYLAVLANTYVDPDFLHYEGDFPLSESFQIHFLVEVEGDLRHFGIHLVPRRNQEFPDGFEIIPKLYRYHDGEASEPLPVEGHAQRLNKSLPHMAVEAFFPVSWLGKEKLEAGTKLRMNVLLATYYGESAMAWSGEPTLRNMANPAVMRSVLLGRPHRERRASFTHPFTQLP